MGMSIRIISHDVQQRRPKTGVTNQPVIRWMRKGNGSYVIDYRINRICGHIHVDDLWRSHQKQIEKRSVGKNHELAFISVAHLHSN
jgi:hypothetical protein